jgi:hypothetical protein
LVGHVLGIVASLGFGGWDSPEAVHEALLVVPAEVVGGDELDVAEDAQRAAPERRVSSDALVLVQADSGLGQGVVIGLSG